MDQVQRVGDEASVHQHLGAQEARWAALAQSQRPEPQDKQRDDDHVAARRLIGQTGPLQRRDPAHHHCDHHDRDGDHPREHLGGLAGARAVLPPAHRQVGEGAGCELGRDTDRAGPALREEGVVVAGQPDVEQGSQAQEGEQRQYGRAEPVAGTPQHQDEQGEEQVGQPLHGKRPRREVPPTTGIWAPLLDHQDLLKIRRDRHPVAAWLTLDDHLGEGRQAGNVEHHEVDRIHPGQAQPPEVQAARPTELSAQPREVGVGQDEAGQREEQVDADRSEPQELVQDGEQQTAGRQRRLEVIEHHPGGGYEPHSGELLDEIAHARQS